MTSEPGSAAMERTDYIAEAITAHWGERCPDTDPECFCCQAWAQYDRIADTEADLLRRHNDAADRYEVIAVLTRERDEAREALKLVREWLDHISDDDNIIDAADEADKMADVQIAVDAALAGGKQE